ncbi:MAG: rhodanese-like domain-containing protein [Planctomycetota bacterium]
MGRPLLPLLAVLIGAAPAVAADADDYARPELLTDQPELTRLLLDAERRVVVLDVRSQRDYAAGAVPTARRIDIAEWKAAFGDGSDAEGWGERLGRLGIDAQTTVVVYDAATSPNATRAWWILKYWGVDDTRLIDGGYRAWTPPGPAKTLAPPPPTLFIAEPQPDRLATRGEVLDAVSEDRRRGVCLVDTRTGVELLAGKIPTAAHSDWVRYVDPATGRLRTPGELRRLLAEVGFEPTLPAVTYCRTGGRASVVAFVMELMGGKQVANYYGSWNDWSKAGFSEVRAAPVSP